VVSIDGSTLDVPDEADNKEAFGTQVPGHGETAFPIIRFVSLCEVGTHVLFGTRMAPYSVGEVTLAEEVLPRLKPDMLCLADRGFYSFRLWKLAQATGLHSAHRPPDISVILLLANKEVN
jgi:hypothetical protein